MTLINKALLVIFVVSLVLLGIVHTVVFNILENSYGNLERVEVSQDSLRLERAIDNQADSLRLTTQDWAWWDDTVQYVEERNEDFASANLHDDTWQGLDIGLVLIADSNGEVVFSKHFDPATGQESPLPETISAKLGTDDKLVSHFSPSTSVSGLIRLPAGPMLVASYPILTSKGEGPVHGTLLFGRYLNDEMIGKLAYITNLETKVLAYDDTQLPEEVRAGLLTFDDASDVVVLPEDTDWVSGYRLINDIYGNPIGVTQVRQERVEYSQGTTTIQLLSWALVIVCVVLCIVILVLLRKMVLVPVARLTGEVKELEKLGTAIRLSVVGHDEISHAALAVNHMLDSMETTRKQQLESDRRYISFIENAPEGIVLVDTQSKSFIHANSSFALMVGKDNKEILSLKLAEVFPLYYDDQNSNVVRALFDNQSLVGERHLKRNDGTLLDVDVTATAISLDSRETVCLVVRDISEQKRAEEAMRHRLAMEELIATLSTRLINVRASDVYAEIEHVLEEIGQMIDAKRIFVALLAPDRASFDKLLSWRRPGLQALTHDITTIPLSAFAWTSSQLRRGETVHVSDTASLPPDAEPEKMLWSRLGVQAIVFVPIFWGNSIGGVLGLDAESIARSWTTEDARLLRVVGQILENLLNRKRAEEALERAGFHDGLTDLYNRAYFEEEIRRCETERLYPITMISTDVNGLKLVNDTMGHQTGDDLLKVYAQLLKENYRQTDVVARIGCDEFAIIMSRTDRETGEAVCRRLEKRVETHNKAHPDLPLSISWGLHTSEWPMLPLEEAFKQADANMYQDKLRRATSDRRSLVDTLLTALSTKDHVCEGHTKRVGIMASNLAKAMNLSQKEESDLVLLAEVHDIGKVGIQERVLLKNGPLTDKERAKMKEHAALGYKIAVSSPALAHIAELILHHHEWWDGSGYPAGLQGEEIPLLCRMVAIADAFDAMTNDRPYRKALTGKEALRELDEMAGRQFDPNLVPLFASVLNSMEREEAS